MAAITRVVGVRARWRETTVGEYGSEFLGTFVLIMFGDGAVAMTVAALNQSGRGDELFAAAGDWMLIATGWGLAVALAVYVAGGISSAHINPAVTLAMAVFRDFPWRKVPGYMVAQVLGAFVARALIYLNYKQAINSFEAANDITRGEENSIPSFSIFATFPAEYYSSAAGPFLDELIGYRPTGRHRPGAGRPIQRGSEGEHGAIDHRFRGVRDRDVLRRQLRLRDQPGA